MQQFKGLLRKYPEAFYLLGTKLGTVKDFFHNIGIGQSPLVYRLPYRKGSAELCAIKSDLQKMLMLSIIQPIHLPGERHVFLSENLWKRTFHSPRGLLWTIAA